MEPEVNNAVSVFTRAAATLELLVQSALGVVRTAGPGLRHIDVGTRFLTELHRRHEFPLITNVGLFSPWLLQQLASGRRALARRYMSDFGYPIRAANLCLTSRNQRTGGVEVTDQMYEAVVARLLATRGRELNRLLPRAASKA